jgi:hypothetical protein
VGTIVQVHDAEVIAAISSQFSPVHRIAQIQPASFETAYHEDITTAARSLARPGQLSAFRTEVVGAENLGFF